MRRTASPVEIVPGTITCAFTPRSRNSRPSGELMNLSASDPNRAENFAHPVCGSSEIWTTTVSPICEPAADRKAFLVEADVDEQVVAGERPALRLGDQPEHACRRDRELVVAVHASVRVHTCRPAVAHEPFLDRELRGVGRLALALARADDDQLQRPLLGAEFAELGKPLVEALAGHVQVGAHGSRC